MVTAVAQLVLVWLTDSAALLADTIHNFSDALTSVPLWIAFVLGQRRPIVAIRTGMDGRRTWPGSSWCS